jgi:hypothetical protein
MLNYKRKYLLVNKESVLAYLEKRGHKKYLAEAGPFLILSLQGR